MPDILNLLAQNPLIIAALGVILFSIIFMYFVAFFQGREISFYPPKIGEHLGDKGKGMSTKKSTTKNHDKQILSDAATGTCLTPPIIAEDVFIGPLAQDDCEQISISADKVTAFIIEEAMRHPALFLSSFSTLPLVFESNIIILSWDGYQVVIERVLDRSEAYPTSNAWFSCVSVYRQATALSYRNRSEKVILTEVEIRQTINLYKKLLKSIEQFIKLNQDDSIRLADDFSVFQSLLDEAEISLFGENPDIGIVRLEALLSSIHKFLMLNAPQRKSSQAIKHSSTPKLTGRGDRSILLVDDQLSVLEELEAILGSQDCYRIATARNGEEALKAMVENNYDLVVTDVVMPVVDGREVAIGAKVISPKTKVLVLTSFVETSKQADMPFDYILLKDITKKEFLDCIRDLLEK